MSFSNTREPKGILIRAAQGILSETLLQLYGEYKQARKKKALLRSFKGDAVECPLCKSHFRIFGTFGSSNRVNARCHQCGSLERHRLIWLFLKRKLHFPPDGKKIKLLHLAPEKMMYRIFSKSRSIDYTPCDLNPDRYNFKGRVQVIQADITALRFEENAFDFILCNHVLEHVPDDRTAMRELYRVMKPGGAGIFQVPISTLPTTYEDFSIQSPEERTKAFGQHDHVRVYGTDYTQRLRHAGFKVTEDAFVKSFSQEECYRYGLNPTEVLFYCEK